MIRLNPVCYTKSRLCQSLCLLLFMLFGVTFFHSQAYAETIILSDTIPSQNTNWIDALTIPAFDPKLGELTAITLTFETPIIGSVSYENTSNETVLITSTHAISVNLQLPNGTVLNNFPSVFRTDTVPPFDGRADFGGTSGASFELNTSLHVSQVYTTSADLAWFYGVDLLRFPVTAKGASSIRGPGNFNAILRTQAAGANFTTYLTYLPLEFAVKKLTNGRDADGADDADVPIISPRAPVTWTYLVTNTGAMAIPLADITVTDSDPHVIPLFDPASDDGDRILAPGEVWRYYAVGTALDLSIAERTPLVVDGCRGTTDPQALRAYENFVTVTIRDVAKMDPSHYCNPTTRRFEPALAFAKLINGFDANGPDDHDVPFVFPGTVLTWTYLVTNTGNISFTFDQVTLQDDDRSLQINFDATSDDGNAMLQPGEQWRFFARGAARNLLFDTTSITIVAGCDPNNSGNKSAAYRNIGMVTVGNLRITDPAHYCNFPPTEIADDSRGREETRSLYLPLIAR